MHVLLADDCRGTLHLQTSFDILNVYMMSNTILAAIEAGAKTYVPLKGALRICADPGEHYTRCSIEGPIISSCIYMCWGESRGGREHLGRCGHHQHYHRWWQGWIAVLWQKPPWPDCACQASWLHPLPPPIHASSQAQRLILSIADWNLLQ